MSKCGVYFRFPSTWMVRTNGNHASQWTAFGCRPGITLVLRLLLEICLVRARPFSFILDTLWVILQVWWPNRWYQSTEGGRVVIRIGVGLTRTLNLLKTFASQSQYFLSCLSRKIRVRINLRTKASQFTSANYMAFTVFNNLRLFFRVWTS